MFDKRFPEIWFKKWQYPEERTYLESIGITNQASGA